MYQFFNSILKNKKVVLFALLFFVLAGFTLPQIAFAGIAAEIADAFTNYVLKGAIAPFILLPLYVIQFITGLGAVLVTFSLDVLILFSTRVVIYTSLNPTENPAVSLGWPIIRDLANIAVVLGLIAIAMATILRIQAYGAKSLLPKLIIAALLVNFSLVICGVIIDFSNLLIRFFLVGLSTKDQANVGIILNFWETIKDLFSPRTGVIELVFRLLGTIFYNTMVIVVYGLFVFLFLFRIFAIFSPLAFVLYVFPLTKKFFDMWWENFIQWCLVGVFGAFFLYLGKTMMSLLINQPQTLGLIEMLSNDLSVRGLAAVVSSFFNLLRFFIPGTFLIIGFLFSLKFSAMGSGIVIGAAKTVGGYARAGAGWATKKGLTYGADKSGLTKEMQKVQNRATQALEDAGLLRAGYTKAKMQKQQQPSREAEEAAAAQDAKGRQQSIMAGPGISKSGQEEFMSNFEKMEKNGELQNMESADLKRAMDTYAGITGKTNKYSINPDTATLDTDRINELKLKYRRAGGETEAAYNTRINGMATRESYENMDTKDINIMTDTELGKLTEGDNAKSSKAIEKLIKEGKKHLIRGGDKTQLENALDVTQKYGVATNIYSKASPDLAFRDKDKVREVLTKQGIPLASATLPQLANAKKIAARDAFDHMDTKDIKDKNDEDLVKLAEEETAEGAKALEEVIKRGIIHKVHEGSLTQIPDTAKLLDMAQENYGSVSRKGAEKLDPRLAKESKELDDAVAAGTMTLAAATTEKTIRSNKAYSKLEVADIRKMADNAINMDLIYNTTAKKIEKAGEDLSADKLKKLKDLILPGGALTLAIAAAPAGPVKVDLEAKRDAISVLK